MTVLRLGSSGPLVGALHQRLLEAGHSVDRGELETEVYGISTERAVRVLQASPDPLCGTRT